MSRTIYWEELLFFSYELMHKSKQNEEKIKDENNHIDQNNKVIDPEKINKEISKEIDPRKNNPTEDVPSSKDNVIKINKKIPNTFELSDPNPKLEDFKEEFIKFSIYEYYDQGQEIFLCSTKLKVGEMMRKTNKFLFDLSIKNKQLGKLKIGII